MLKIGSKVKLRKDSQYYRQAPGAIGVVKMYTHDEWYPYVVRFKRYDNSYRHKDLVVISKFLNNFI